MKHSAIILALTLCAAAGGCARVAVEGGDKPIHIVMDVNIKIDQKLDQFFAYEDVTNKPATRAATTEPASNTASNGGAQ